MRSSLTVDVDDRLRDVVERVAREDGVGEAEVVEEALRRYFGLRGIALLDEIAARQDQAPGNDEAMAIAISEIRAARAARRAKSA